MYDAKHNSFRCNAEVGSGICNRRAKYSARGVFSVLDYCEKHKHHAQPDGLKVLPDDHQRDPRFPR